MTGRTLVEELLVSGLKDPAYAAWVRAIATQSGLTNSEQLRELALGLITEVICLGLMVPGDYDQGGHHAWPHSPGDAIERIAREWLNDSGDEAPTPGAIVWLANTESGNDVALRVLERETTNQ
ncbi:MAG: hypothetical protein ACRD0Z_04735 [Acidimicrobiales bacterium]